MLELYTFSVSHFCEKARWALDRAGLPYRERFLIPGAHLLTMRRLAPMSTVPLLVDRRRVIQGSIAIYDYVDGELAPGSLSRLNADDDAARALEGEIDEGIGVCGRRIAYSGTRSDMSTIGRLWRQAGPSWARAFYWLAFPVVAAKVQRMYQSDEPVAVRQAHDEIARAFDQFDALLAHKPYLAGDHPGRADFALASLLAPIRFPAEHPLPWAQIPPSLQQLRVDYENRPTLRHVEIMYRKHRHAGAPYRVGRGGARLPAPSVASGALPV